MPIRLESRLNSAPSYKGPFEREAREVPNLLARKGSKQTRTVIVIDVTKPREAQKNS